MTGRDRVAMVCRDCGEVGHFELAGLKPGSLVSCAACGLVTNPWQLRAPVYPLRGRSAPPAAPRRRGAAR